MPDSNLVPAHCGGLRLARLDGLECVVLRIRGTDPDLLRRVEAVLGAPLPLQPNTVSGTVPRILWLAPAEWLLVSEQPLAAIVEGLEGALAGTTFHIADVSHGRTVFAVAGPQAAAFIARGCSLDLHPRVFAPGRCAQSLFAQVPVLIHHHSSGPTLHLYFDASFEAHLRRWFERASHSFETVTMR